jgi:hypothetical protein
MNNYCTRQPNSKLQEYKQPVTWSETDEILTIFGDVWFTAKRYIRRMTNNNEYDLNQTLVMVLGRFHHPS